MLSSEYGPVGYCHSPSGSLTLAFTRWNGNYHRRRYAWKHRNAASGRNYHGHTYRHSYSGRRHAYTTPHTHRRAAPARQFVERL